jgi:hypothetical protein
LKRQIGAIDFGYSSTKCSVERYHRRAAIAARGRMWRPSTVWIKFYIICRGEHDTFRPGLFIEDARDAIDRGGLGRFRNSSVRDIHEDIDGFNFKLKFRTDGENDVCALSAALESIPLVLSVCIETKPGFYEVAPGCPCGG